MFSRPTHSPSADKSKYDDVDTSYTVDDSVQMLVDDSSDKSVDSVGDHDIGTATPVWIITVVLCGGASREQCSHRGLIDSNKVYHL